MRNNFKYCLHNENILVARTDCYREIAMAINGHKWLMVSKMMAIYGKTAINGYHKKTRNCAWFSTFLS